MGMTLTASMTAVHQMRRVARVVLTPIPGAVHAEIERNAASFLDRLLAGGWSVRRTERLGVNLAERIVGARGRTPLVPRNVAI